MTDWFLVKRPRPNADVEKRGSAHSPEGYGSPALLPHIRLGSIGHTLDSPTLKLMRGGGWVWIYKQPPRLSASILGFTLVNKKLLPCTFRPGTR